jgi:hypothetical protein
MADPNELTLERPLNASQEIRIEEMTIREQLSAHRPWETQDGLTPQEMRRAAGEQMIQREQLRNEQLQTVVQRTVPQGNAVEAAPGQPQQVQAPARETRKERKERERRAKEAQKHNPAADHVSYAAVEMLKQLNEERLNSLDRQTIGRAAAADVDTRVLKVFTQGYKKDKRGRPADAEQQRRMTLDRAFLDDYISKDPVRRQPHLERMTEELLAVNFTPDMFTDAYIEQHLAEMKILADRATYFSNIYRDPDNASFFAGLSQERRDLIEARVIGIGGAAGSLLASTLAARGVLLDSAKYDTDPRGATAAKEMIAPNRLFFEQQRANAATQESALGKRMVQGRIEEKRAELMRESEETQAAVQEDESVSGLGLTGFVTGDLVETLAKNRSTIESHPGEYARNKDTVNMLYGELRQGIDALGDAALETRALQALADDLRVRQPKLLTPENRLMLKEIVAQQEALNEKTKIYRSQIDQMSRAIAFFTEGRPPEQDVRVTMTQLGIGEGAVMAEMRQRIIDTPIPEVKMGAVGGDDSLQALRRVFLEQQANGGPGAVESANRAYRDALADLHAGTIKESDVQTKVFLALGLRRNAQESSAEKAFRGNLLDGYGSDFVTLFSQMEKNGVDFASVKERIQTAGGAATAGAKYSYGEGFDEISVKMLDMFGAYLNSKESLDYMSAMCDTLNGVEYFGSLGDRLSYVVNNLINRVGGNPAYFTGNENKFKAPADVEAVAKAASSQMMRLPILARLSEEQKNTLPQSTRQAVQQYENMMAALEQKVETRQRQLEAERADQERYKAYVAELVPWATEFARTGGPEEKRARVANALRDEFYGDLLSLRASEGELTKQYKKRRSDFQAPYEELAKAKVPGAGKYIGGNALQRDIVAYLGADATDEQIKQGIDDMDIIWGATKGPEDVVQAAKQRIADKFPAYYQRILEMVRASGIKTDKSSYGSNKEELIHDAGKLYEIHFFAQIGRALCMPLAGFVPPEQLSFVDAVLEYVRNLMYAARPMLNKDPEEATMAVIMQEIKDGDMTLGKNINVKMAAALELDEKAKRMRQGGQ